MSWLISIAFFNLLLTFFLVSCGNDILEENKLYTVKFEENGGKEVEDIVDLKKGSTITLPSVERPGYVFKGWYFWSGNTIGSNTGFTIIAYAVIVISANCILVVFKVYNIFIDIFNSFYYFFYL